MQGKPQSEKPIVGISTGDLNGIGPELIIKTLSDNRITEWMTPVVFASNKLINFYRKGIPDHPFSFHSIKDFSRINPKQTNVFNCWEEEVPLQPGVFTDTGGKYAVRSLMVATQCLKDGQIDALVTGPLHKANSHSSDFPFLGHTPFLKEQLGAKDVLMLLFHDSLRIALVTEHLPLKDVSAAITPERIQSKYLLFRDSLVRDFGIDRPKIALLGLNPHAGDRGSLGKEEEQTLLPWIESMQKKGALVYGPYAADSFFARGDHAFFDGILAMYHDQGLVAFKTLAAGAGVQFTAGLPKIRTSPDHGTAFDIAGKNKADIRSFQQALFSAVDLLRQRNQYEENTRNPLSKARIDKEKSDKEK